MPHPTYTQDPTPHERAASSTGGKRHIPPFPPMYNRAPRAYLGTRTKIRTAAARLGAFAPQEWTYYDSICSPLSNSRVQLRGT